MKHLFIAIVLLCLNQLTAQDSKVDFNKTSDLKMETEYTSQNQVLDDLLSFDGVEYLKIKFSGKELKGKSYHLTVKEIWDGNIVKDTTVVNSKDIGVKQLETLSDSIFNFRVISKLTNQNKLKMTFKFERFSISREYDAIDSENYSLRNIADESRLPISCNEKFYLLAYILPYEREDGSKSWCEVGSSGNEIEKWGEKFGIKHYLLFEIKFE